jgi:MYXO-CTERM domain-containing protein
VTTSSALRPSTLCAFLVALCGGAEAHANGRFPAAGQLVVHPKDESTIAVQTTYGFITTHDGGASWAWTCEEAAFYSGILDPPIAITESGALLAGVFDGLAVSPDGCSYGLVPGGLIDKVVVDVSVERMDPRRAIAVTSNGMSGNTFLTELWETGDNGATWAIAGVALPTDFLALTGDVAPSNPDRVYLSGFVPLGGSEYQGVIERTSDRGESWQRFEVPDTAVDDGPFLAAVHPDNADLLYVRLTGIPGRLLRSDDGGETWEEIFVGKGKLKGFAQSPDGTEITVGGDDDGLWRSSAADLAFQKVSEIGVQCLTWAASGLYACGREGLDGFTVGVSLDRGETFTPLHHLSCLDGPVSCDPATEVGALCPSAWPATAAAIQANTCAGGGGGSGGGGGGEPPEDDPSCCTVAPGSATPSRGALFALLLGGLAFGARRRRS